MLPVYHRLREEMAAMTQPQVYEDGPQLHAILVVGRQPAGGHAEGRRADRLSREPVELG